jgi:hypothetical protein
MKTISISLQLWSSRPSVYNKHLTNQPTNFTGLNSREAYSWAATQHIMEPESSLRCFHQPCISITSQINPVHIIPSYIKSCLILSTTSVLVFPIVPSFLIFPLRNEFYMHSYSAIRAARIAHLMLFDFMAMTIPGEECRSRSSSLCRFLQPPVTSSLLGPNILLRILFSYNLSLHSSFDNRGQVAHPYRTTGKITVLYILIFTVLESRREDNTFWTEQ